MKKVIIFFLISFSSIIFQNNTTFADYEISDTLIEIDSPSDLTCKTGKDGVEICYPNLYTWTTKTGTDGRVVAYPNSYTWTTKTGTDGRVVAYPSSYTWTTKTGTDGRVVAYPSSYTWTTKTGTDGRVVAYPSSYTWTTKTGTDGRVVAYPSSYTWTTKTGTDGRVVAYPTGKENEEGIIYASDDLYTIVTLDQLEILKELEDVFSESEYEEYLLHFIINNPSFISLNSNSTSTTNTNYNSGYKNSSEMNEDICMIARGYLSDLYDYEGSNIVKLTENTTNFKFYLDLAESIPGCLTTNIYPSQYYFKLGEIGRLNLNWNDAINNYKKSVKIDEEMGKYDKIYTMKIGLINTISFEKSLPGLCGINSYYTPERECSCNEGFIWEDENDSNNFDCKMPTNVNSSESKNTGVTQNTNSETQKLDEKIEQVKYAFYKKYKNTPEAKRTKIYDNYVQLLSKVDLNKFDEEKQYLIKGLITGFIELRDMFEYYEFVNQYN